MLICTMFSAVSQILLKQSANEEHASALREYLNWPQISVSIFLISDDEASF